MSRSARFSLNARLLLTALISLAILFSILPARWSFWIAALARPVKTILTPIQQPLASITQTNRLRSNNADLLAREELLRQRNDYETRTRNLEIQNEILLKTIANLQAGAPASPDFAAALTRQYAARVIGPATDLSSRYLRVHAGRRDGLPSTRLDDALQHAVPIAIAAGSHLVGRVVHVSERFSEVHLITDKAAGNLSAYVALHDQLKGPACQSVDRRSGRILFDLSSNSVQDPASGQLIPVAVGQLVRLDDDTWPLTAQGYVIGRIERIDPKPENPLRQQIVVRPELDLRRLGDLVIRWNADLPANGSLPR